MKKRSIILPVCFLMAFLLWTILVCFADVKQIGPNGSSVGLATVNGFTHELFGVNMGLYVITDWLGLVPVGFMFGFASLGLIQWIKRKGISKVDRSILLLGAFYILVLAAYLLFEEFVVNYRPVLINGYLEASYPSSTTMLVMCVIPTSIMQLRTRIQKKSARNIVCFILAAFVVFMVIGRLVSGVHWLSDIIGGVLISAGLDLLYKSVAYA